MTEHNEYAYSDPSELVMEETLESLEKPVNYIWRETRNMLTRGFFTIFMFAIWLAYTWFMLHGLKWTLTFSCFLNVWSVYFLAVMCRLFIEAIQQFAYRRTYVLALIVLHASKMNEYPERSRIEILEHILKCRFTTGATYSILCKCLDDAVLNQHVNKRVDRTDELYPDGLVRFEITDAGIQAYQSHMSQLVKSTA